MFYLILFKFFVAVIIGLVLLSQVLIPMIKGTKLFPYFSSKRTKLQNEIKNVRDDIDIHELETKLDTLKKSNQSGDKSGLSN